MHPLPPAATHQQPRGGEDEVDAPSHDHGALDRGGAAVLASSVFVAPLLLSWSTAPSPNHPRIFLWYRLLRQPGYKPPDASVPVAWLLIEACMATGAYRLLRRAASPARDRALALLAVNTLSIGGWSRLFFGKRRLPAATVAAAAMVGTGAAYVAQARVEDRPAAVAGVPFVLWVAFATVLTAGIWRRNR